MEKETVRRLAIKVLSGEIGSLEFIQKPVGEEHAYNHYLTFAISSESRCAAKSLSVLNRLIHLEISHVWWTRLLDPLQTARLNFCASRDSTERLVAGRPRRLF